MSNTSRKERKRKGDPFVRVPKIGTPLEERSIPLVQDRNGRTRGAIITHISNRAARKLALQIMVRDIDRVVPEEVVAKRKSALKKKSA